MNVRCIECGNDHLIMDYVRCELVCQVCGLVNEDFYIGTQDIFNSIDNNGGNVHYGSPNSWMIHDRGLSTEIDWKNIDAYGNKISYKNSIKMQRLRKVQFYTNCSNSSERNLIKALNEINRISQEMDLPRSLRENASAIYRKAVNKNLIRGHSIKGIAAASLYLACRSCGVPRALDELSKYSNINRKKIGRASTFLKRELNIETQLPTPNDYISRFCSKLKLDMNASNKCFEILNSASKKGLFSGKEPHGLAGAAIYIASILCNQRRKQREISEVTGVSEVTIRKRYKELKIKLGIEV